MGVKNSFFLENYTDYELVTHLWIVNGVSLKNLSSYKFMKFDCPGVINSEKVHC